MQHKWLLVRLRLPHTPTISYVELTYFVFRVLTVYGSSRMLITTTATTAATSTIKYDRNKNGSIEMRT